MNYFYKILFAYILGYLPFMHVGPDAFSMAWLTRNYGAMIMDGVAEEKEFSKRV